MLFFFFIINGNQQTKENCYFNVTRLQASIRLLILIDLDHNLNYATKRTEKRC